MNRVALATYANLPGLNDDDRLLIPALDALGLSAAPAVWDAPDVRWDEFRAVMVRSCWDYHHRLEEFLAWVDRLERAGVPLWNPPAVLRWNSHKGYLRDLEACGVPIVPTRWLARGQAVDLARLLRHEAWGAALGDREARGVPIVPTRGLARGQAVARARLLRQEAGRSAVVKPAVSASAFGT